MCTIVIETLTRLDLSSHRNFIEVLFNFRLYVGWQNRSVERADPGHFVVENEFISIKHIGNTAQNLFWIMLEKLVADVFTQNGKLLVKSDGEVEHAQSILLPLFTSKTLKFYHNHSSVFCYLTK